MNAQTAFHVNHFTAVLDGMDDFDHFRRLLVTCIGFHLLSGGGDGGGKQLNPVISSAGVHTDHKPTKGTCTCANFMARGSDALTDAGSVDNAIEALYLNPLDWTFVHHTLSTHDCFDSLNQLNTRSSNWARELVNDDIVQDPTDFTCYKLFGVFLADILNTNRIARHQNETLSLNPLTIDAQYIVSFIADFEDMAALMGRAKTTATDAMQKRGKVVLQ